MPFQKGNKINLGKKHSEETRRKMSLAKKGKPQKGGNKGKHWKIKDISKMNKDKMGKLPKNWHPLIGFKRGKLNPGWKDGRTPLIGQIRKCFKYRQWRSDVFTRDDFTCQECGIRGGYLEADHYPKMFSIIFHDNKIKTLEEALICEEFWNINNGRTLCSKCHNKTKSPIKLNYL